MECFQSWYNSGNYIGNKKFTTTNAKPLRTTTILCVPMAMVALSYNVDVCEGYERHHHCFHQDVSAGDVPQG